MPPTFHRTPAATLDPLTEEQSAALVAQAGKLMNGADHRPYSLPLQGRQLALVCAEPDHEHAHLFRRAAAELGARVVLIRIEVLESGTPQQVEASTRLLGRLYDAVECQGTSLGLWRRLSASTDVPVHAGLATPAHPTARLAGALAGDAPPEDKRRFVLQAALLQSLL